MEKPQTPLYFTNFWTDFLFMGGLSILAFPLFYLFKGEIDVKTVMMMALGFNFVINFPHFFATSFRLYRSKENMRQFPFTSTVLPFLLLIVTILCFVFPSAYAPYVVALYLIWSPYHFSGQTVGLTMVYGRRSGFFIGKWQRLCLSSFVFGTFLTLYAEYGAGARLGFDALFANGDLGRYFGLTFINIPAAEIFVTLCYAIMISGGLGFLYFLGEWAKAENKSVPLILLTPAIAQLCWFITAQKLGLFAFAALVAMFHSIQYLYVAWAVQLKEKYSDNPDELTERKAVMETGLWYFYNILGGLAFFVGLPFVFHFFTGAEPLFTMGIIFAMVQIHHFFVDGVIWKLRSPAAFSALTVNIPEWIGKNGKS